MVMLVESVIGKENAFNSTSWVAVVLFGLGLIGVIIGLAIQLELGKVSILNSRVTIELIR